MLAPLSWLLVALDPRGVRPEVDGGPAPRRTRRPPEGATLGEALRTPAFWVFALASSAYGLVASGIALFNESILAERGFDPATYYRSLVVTALTALVGNFAGGALRRAAARCAGCWRRPCCCSPDRWPRCRTCARRPT